MIPLWLPILPEFLAATIVTEWFAEETASPSVVGNVAVPDKTPLPEDIPDQLTGLSSNVWPTVTVFVLVFVAPHEIRGGNNRVNNQFNLFILFFCCYFIIEFE